ncbi:Sec7 domain-containing protein, partial [Catenaria anguillulae PL171]
RKAQVRAAVELFRTSPKQAVEYLTKNALVPLTRGEDKERDAQVLAAFLFDAPTIDKAMVGEYISKPAHALLLSAYMARFDFVGLRMDQALRAMMQRFRLPGESQMIDRILDTFAKHFFSQNPNQTEIANMDAGFILAFSMIMLNTDQHNPQVRNRMDVDSFCRNLRGLNNKQDFRRGFLEEVFKEIHEREI